MRRRETQADEDRSFDRVQQNAILQPHRQILRLIEDRALLYVVIEWDVFDGFPIDEDQPLLLDIAQNPIGGALVTGQTGDTAGIVEIDTIQLLIEKDIINVQAVLFR